MKLLKENKSPISRRYRAKTESGFTYFFQKFLVKSAKTVKSSSLPTSIRNDPTVRIASEKIEKFPEGPTAPIPIPIFPRSRKLAVKHVSKS